MITVLPTNDTEYRPQLGRGTFSSPLSDPLAFWASGIFLSMHSCTVLFFLVSKHSSLSHHPHATSLVPHIKSISPPLGDLLQSR